MAQFEVLEKELEATKRGSLLLNEQKQGFIKTIPDFLEKRCRDRKGHKESGIVSKIQRNRRFLDILCVFARAFSFFRRLIPEQTKSKTPMEHPLLKVLPDGAFVPANASISVLADYDVLSVFVKNDAWSDLPRFLVAGARQTYCLDPTRLTAGVLTAGGNAPGLDAIVDSLVKRQFLLGTERCKRGGGQLTEQGFPRGLKFYGIVGGYRGLQDLASANDGRWVMKLHPRVTDAWAERGCSSLHALRTETYHPNVPEFQSFIDNLAQGVRKLGLDILYTVGGNGTLTVADALGKRLLDDDCKPCLVVAGPKTMDNDVNFTDVTFGYRTTVDNAIRLLRDFHREAETLERIGIMELFGAGSGFVALHAAYASGEADYVLIPEMMGETVESAREELEKAIKRVKLRADKKGHALLVVAEGATIKAQSAIVKDTELESFRQGIKQEQEKAFADLVDYVKLKTGYSVFFSQPRHLIRATSPNGFDTDLCKYTGKLMVDTALSGFTRCAVHLWQGNYVLVPLETAVAKLKRVDTAEYYFITMWEKYLLE